MRNAPVSQAPGVYRRRIGDIVVTALNDGYIDADPSVLLDIDPADAAGLLRASCKPLRPRITVNAFLIHSAGRIALVEAGSGAALGPTLGRLPGNLAAAGLEKLVRLQSADVLETTPPAKEGIIVTNPPYGVRLGEQQQLAEFYPKLGDVLKKRFAGWRAYLFTADLRLPKLIRLAASRRIPLFNGALECRLYEYRMVGGKMQGTK